MLSQTLITDYYKVTNGNILLMISKFLNNKVFNFNIQDSKNKIDCKKQKLITEYYLPIRKNKSDFTQYFITDFYGVLKN
jgi:hypothetical protein